MLLMGIDHEKIGNARIKRYQVLKPYLDQRDGKYNGPSLHCHQWLGQIKFFQTIQMLIKTMASNY